MTDQRSFRDQLLAVEPLASNAGNQLQQEIHDMLTKELTTPRKIIFSMVTLFVLGSAGIGGFLALTESELPPAARIGLATGTLFGLAWVVSLVRILRRGVIDVKTDHRRIAQMVWVFTVLMVTFFLFLGMTSPDGVKGLMMIAYSLVFLIGAAVYWLSFRIEEAELNVKEHLLRLELQLAESVNKDG